MVRNHASILLWVGGNEYPPPSDLDKGLSDLVSKLDPNRLYLSSSLSGGVGPGDGPYNINNPKWFFLLSFFLIYLFNIINYFH